MGYSRKLGPPIVSAAVATIALTSFAIVTLVQQKFADSNQLFNSVWPIVLTSAVAVTLVMSLLYKSLVELVLELEKREIAAQHQALHDQLTGLANRALLEDRLDQAMSRHRRRGEVVALLMLDLDRFKQVNDTLGHSAGDKLVQQVASRLKTLLRETDTVARIGGDEFAVVLANVRGETDVRLLCEKMIEAIGEPFHLDDMEARVGVSIGALIAGSEAGSAAELLRKADITMYGAKAAGRNCYRIFSSEMDVAVQRRDQLEKGLRRALETGIGLDVHFQPQLSSAGLLTGAEALLRWNHDLLGSVAPAEAVPVAEDCGLIDQLGEFVFKRACAAARKWPAMSVAVNLSPLQFRRHDLVEILKGIAGQAMVECSQLELEITEGLLIDYGQMCEQTIQDLRAAGFRVALDQFGTGYSSLSCLRRFQVDKVKLDRSFIATAHANESVAMIRAAVTLGHAMHLQVVAEGISDESQERIALEAGCDGVQGQRYAEPMAMKRMDEFLKSYVPGRLAAAA